METQFANLFLCQVLRLISTVLGDNIFMSLTEELFDADNIQSQQKATTFVKEKFWLYAD